MSEYIIEWFDIGGQLANLLNGNVALVLWPKKIREERLREKIVRCRNCKHYDDLDAGCSYFVLASNNLLHIGNPDGYCAWGIKK